MDKITKFVGIDISKDVFDVSFPDGNHMQFTNDKKSYGKLLMLLQNDSHCVMEATGPYHLNLATWLLSKCVAVSVVNPLVIKRFVQMRLKLAKTDKADAKMIRLYAELENPEQWSPPSEYIQQASEMNSLTELFIRQRTALKNKLQTIQVTPGDYSLVTKMITKQIRNLDKQISDLDLSMQELIRKNQGELLSRLSSIPGIGTKTAMFLIVITDGFQAFESSKQLSAYFGLAPTIRLSGKTVRGQSRISKTGNNSIRNLLFMCSFTACKNNLACKNLYERIVTKGKSKKLALIAVANKLLKQCLAIAKSGMMYDENYRSIQPSFH
jgi:transposase